MAGASQLAPADIDDLLAKFEVMRPTIELFQEQLLPALSKAPSLEPHIHSIKSRIKDSGHLRDKLERKRLAALAAEEPFSITPENLLISVNDLVGVRLLHLYTRQIEVIDPALRAIFEEQGYEVLEGPFARTWDDESREFFHAHNIEVQPSPTLYTSVHYVISSASRTKVTCEVQVRTLMEEVWGEVDHQINYPHPTSSLGTSEQLKVLARVTSSATRLVDSIFLTHESGDSDAGAASSAEASGPSDIEQG